MPVAELEFVRRFASSFPRRGGLFQRLSSRPGTRGHHFSVVQVAPRPGGFVSASFVPPRSREARFIVVRVARASGRLVSGFFGSPRPRGGPFQRHSCRPGVGEPRLGVVWAAPASGSLVSASSGRVPSPNNALQRTEAGGGVFSAIHVLRRQPPSLSLSPLGPESFVRCSSMESVFPFTMARRSSLGPLLVHGSPFRHIVSSVHPFPAAAPVLPPPEWQSVLSGGPEVPL